MIKALRTCLGIIIGYLVMVVLLFLVQDFWFGGVSFGESPWSVLLIAGVLSFGAAVVGGIVATGIAGLKSRATGLIMSGVVVIETTFLLTTGQVAGPLWFDLLGSGSLVAGILLGSELWNRLKNSNKEPVAA
jgi:hypothetical protein